jgi:hypothetical protein
MSSLAPKSVSLQNRSKIISYVIIGLVVVLFNLKSLGVHVIILDDFAHYAEIVEGKFGYARFHRSLIDPFFFYFFAKIMSYSAPMARVAILSLVMVPLSFIVYHICARYLSLPKTLSIFCAVIPQILPGQAYVPTFVIGSYNTWSLLIFFVALLSFFKYLEQEKIAFWLMGTLFYFGAVDSTETSIFLAAPLVVALLWFRKFNKRHVTVILTILGVAACKVAFVLLAPYSNVNTPRFLGVREVVRRFKQMLTWDLPNPGINEPVALFIFAAIVALGLIVLVAKPIDLQILRQPTKKSNIRSSDRRRMAGLCLFGIAWVCASILPFLASTYFSSRYAYILGFGLNFLFILSVYSIFERGKLKKYHLSLILLAILTVFVGIERGKRVEATFKWPDWVHTSIQRSLIKYDFPKESQIVIVGEATGYLMTGGYWNWSSGYLKYATGRADVSGLVGKEEKRYDPFVTSERSYDFQMHGLDMNKPLFLFRFEKGALKQVRYCLQWREAKGQVEWSIYHINLSNGRASNYATGNSKSDYEKAIERLARNGVTRREVLWSG